MPYTNIVFVKFKIKILQDYRFSDCLNDSQKLLFMGLLVLGGICENAIPNNPSYIKRQLNLESPTDHIEKNIEHIAGIFPKLLIANGVIAWDNFEEIHNYTIGKSKEIQRESEGIPEESQRLCQNKKKNKKKKEKEKEITHPPFVSLSNEELKVFYVGYGKSVTNLYIEKINDYLSSTGKAAYKDYAATIRNWMRKDQVKQLPPKQEISPIEKPMSDEEWEENKKKIDEWKKNSPEWQKIMGRKA